MATSGGPNIITDGLVVHLDAANDKSFRGEPTVNLAANGGLIGMSGITLTYITDEDGWKKYSMSGTFTGGSYPYIMHVTSVSFTGGLQYTTRCTIKTNVISKFNYFGTSNGMNYVNVPMTNSGVAVSTSNSDGSYTVGRTGFIYTNNTTQPGYILSNPINNTTFNSSTDFVWIRDLQVEQKPYATPFVNGTRGNTISTGGGWVDRSGNNNHGELVNSPLYTSEGLGGLNFDGTDSSITIPFDSSMDFSQAQTICMWLKPGTGSNSTRRNPYNQAYGGSGTLTHEPSQTINYYFGTHGGNSSPYVGRNSGFTVAPNELAFITVTRSQSLNLCRWYKNGQAGNFSNAGGYSSTNNGNSPILIANGYTSRFLGDIYGVFIYNRYMTQDEVQQMYNATKGRYGL